MLGTVATLILTGALVFITWRYAKSTEVIASQTSNAAESARDAAQISLIQSLLAIQPLLEVTTASVDYLAGGQASERGNGIPVRVEWTVTNAGNGSGFSPNFAVRLGAAEFRCTEPVEPVEHLGKAESLTIVHRAESADFPFLKTYMDREPVDVGELTLRCRDAFGAAVESTVKLGFEEGRVRLRDPQRTYDGGRDLHEIMKRLLNRTVTERSSESREGA